MNQFVSILTPCYNEEANVAALVAAVRDAMAREDAYEYEHVIIDNCSTDGTRPILRRLAAEDRRVKVIFNVRNFGPGRSGTHGFFQTRGAATVCLACDFQDPPELIPEFLRHWEAGAPIVWGRKRTSKEGRFMFFVRTLYYRIIKSFSDTVQYEHVTGFGLYDRRVIDVMKAANDPNPNFRNLISELGYPIDFIEYDQPARRAGKSSYNFFRYFDTALSALINTSRAPLRIATLLGFAMSSLCFLAGMFYLVYKLIYWQSFVVGTAPLVIGLFFIGSVQLFFTGILGEYIGEILQRVTRRPLVVEQERLNFEDKEEAPSD
jgi:polyisoprenyl-phosphate glycosyltransferase